MHPCKLAQGPERTAECNETAPPCDQAGTRQTRLGPVALSVARESIYQRQPLGPGAEIGIVSEGLSVFCLPGQPHPGRPLTDQAASVSKDFIYHPGVVSKGWLQSI